jgi:cbb3-type cytochrome oxidase subunit 3
MDVNIKPENISSKIVIENHTDNSVIPAKSTFKDNIGYLIVMAISIILLYVVNNLFVDAIAPLEPYVINTYPKLIISAINFFVNLHSLIFSDDLVKYLWSINLVLSLSIVGNLVLLIWHPRWFIHLLKGLLLGLAVLPVFLVLTRFPFAVQSQIWQTVLKAFLFTLIVMLMAVAFIEIVRFIFALQNKIRADRSRVSQNPASLDNGSTPISKG